MVSHCQYINGYNFFIHRIDYAVFGIYATRPISRQFIFEGFGLTYSNIRMLRDVFQQCGYSFHYNLVACLFPILAVFFSLFEEYYFHSSSILTTFPRPAAISFLPFLITSIMAGDFIMYSVSFIELYSSKESITTLALPDRCTSRGSLSFATPSR